jgi:hypothetical protein
MAAILSRAKIVSASLSVHVRLRSTSDLPPPRFGITVDLNPHSPDEAAILSIVSSTLI